MSGERQRALSSLLVGFDLHHLGYDPFVYKVTTWSDWVGKSPVACPPPIS